MKIISTLKNIALTAAAVVCAGQASAADIDMTKSVTAFYEKVTSSVANYYLAVSSNESTVYNTSTGIVAMNGSGYIMAIDLYGTLADTKPIRIPAGTYNRSNDTKAFTYYADSEVSYLMYYNDFGNATASYPLDGAVEVTVTESGTYTISASASIDGKKVTMEYVGQLGFDNTEETPYVWPQLRQNIDCTFTNAVAVYDGNLFGSNTGEFYLNLADGELYADNGAIKQPNTTRIAIMLFDVLFSESGNAYVMPGTYNPGRNFRRKTWYPGMEMDYLGNTFPFGTYVQKHCPDMYADSDFGYSYVTDGTIEIARDDNGVYDITVDCLTSYGHTVKGTFHGEIPVVDQSSASSGPASISTLEHDVVCDLEQIPVARLQYNGLGGDPKVCHRLVLDIGSPSGKDQPLVDNGGDIIRFEILQSSDKPYLVEGTYTVLMDKWEGYFAPFGMLPGYFAKNDLTGTRYMHFIEGRYLVMDHLAPAMEGTLGVTKNADGTWTFKFSLIDDAYFTIDGEWTGPVEYTYNPGTIMASTISPDSAETQPRLERLGNNRVRVANLPEGTDVSGFSTSGATVQAQAGPDGVIDLSDLPGGVYIIQAAGKSFKTTR